MRPEQAIDDRVVLEPERCLICGQVLDAADRYYRVQVHGTCGAEWFELFEREGPPLERGWWDQL